MRRDERRGCLRLKRESTHERPAASAAWLLTVALLVGVVAPPDAASARDDPAFAGWLIFGVTYGLPATIGLASAIGADHPSREDRMIHAGLMTPIFGPVMVAGLIIEEHPLTAVAALFCAGFAVLQATGLYMAISAHVREGQPRRRCRRAQRQLRVAPTVGPASVGLVGVF